MTNKLKPMEYVKCWSGDRCYKMPLEDYYEMVAHRHGYDSHEQLKADGLTITKPTTEVFAMQELNEGYIVDLEDKTLTILQAQALNIDDTNCVYKGYDTKKKEHVSFSNTDIIRICNDKKELLASI